jgi:hypothetical protein
MTGEKVKSFKLKCLQNLFVAYQKKKTRVENEGITPEVDESKGPGWSKLGITPEVEQNKAVSWSNLRSC